jgi:hypothetical protein
MEYLVIHTPAMALQNNPSSGSSLEKLENVTKYFERKIGRNVNTTNTHISTLPEFRPSRTPFLSSLGWPLSRRDVYQESCFSWTPVAHACKAGCLGC